MLERTAACLEPCGLRVLPSHKHALRSSRQLRTTFWQHGAAEIEPTAAWKALMHGIVDASTGSLEQTKSPSLGASALLLDFLYPTGAVALLRRRLSPITPDRSDRLSFRSRSRPLHVSPRFYNSSAPRRQRDPSAPGTQEQSHRIKTDDEFEDRNQILPDSSDAGHPTVSSDHTHAVIVDRIMESRDLDQVDLLWQHYKSLDIPAQNARLQQVLEYLSASTRVTDFWKISELFHQLDVSGWDDNTFVAGISAEVNLQNLHQALSIFERGLQSVGLNDTALVDGLDLLLAAAFRSSTTQFLEKIWKLYPEMAARWDFDGITADLQHIASVPGMDEKALMFSDYMSSRLSDSSSSDLDREALQALLKIMVRKALVSCKDSQVVPLLLLTKDLMAFEEVLRSAEKRGKKRVAPDVYSIYRDLPGSSPSHASLHSVFNAYTELKTSPSKMMAGVKLLWDDWLKFHGVPSRRAYQKHLGFHAARGHKERVYALWSEYVERFRDDPTINIFDGQEGSDTFAHLLHVHAVNAEPEEAQRIFDDMATKFKFQAPVYNWNILLNAYVKADDYEGAIGTFDSLCQSVDPDKYSYGTLMQMAGSRGDLAFTVDLYRRARSADVPANDAMLSSLIDAYCQNDHFKEAQDVCARATIKGIIVTRMWNKLLYYNALRRDLTSINEILNTMADKNVPYNRFTYQQLLLGLALCRQSQHALHLLTVALKEKVFQVTPAHFQIVMGALLRTGEPALIRRLCLLMNENKMPITEDILFRLSQALLQWENLSPRERTRRSKKQWLGDALRAFFRIYGHNPENKTNPRAPVSSKPVRLNELFRSGREVYQFSTIMYVFAQLNDSVRVNELVDLYRYVFQSTSDEESILPLPMFNAVMLSGLQDHRHDRVKSTWELLFYTAKSEATSKDFTKALPNTGRISPKYRYALSGGLRVMQEMLFKEGDAPGLQELVRTVREAGFEVDSKNWNYHVQVLVQMKQYKAASTICEKILMPNWTGWFTARTKEAIRSALPLDTRRKGMSLRHLRPTATTLYRLAQAYLELDKLGPWSGDAAATLREIEDGCPQVVRAIKSMIRVYSNLEGQIFDSLELTGVDGAGDMEEETADSKIQSNV